MRTFSVRIDDELFEKVEAERGEKARTDFLREVIESYFITKSSPDHNQASPEQVKKTINEHELLTKLELKEEIIRILEGRVKDLQSQNGFLIQDHTRISGQLDRLLMPSQEEITKKSWWQFWKR